MNALHNSFYMLHHSHYYESTIININWKAFIPCGVKTTIAIVNRMTIAIAITRCKYNQQNKRGRFN